ncbi:MAG: tRNA uridine-5-carboxymethylaminomethyl(34) synthesis GTPase MnmE [Bacilli bacterium]|jgi:tRNA modification GTPase
MKDTIVALATPPLKSALAIIRISGSNALTFAEKLMQKDFSHIKKRDIVYGKLYDNEDVVDEVIALVYVAPFSYTGENVVELITHGSMLIVNQIIELLLRLGARLAGPGEFTSRAFINQKLDLVQAEAVNELINATTKEAKNLALLSLDGEASSYVHELKKEIGDLLSLIEVNIDYPEYEDIEQANKELVLEKTDELLNKIDMYIHEGEQGKIIKEGIKVAIVGKPNVGKSSLLNALMDEDKAIVTNIAGTTRDIVEGSINLEGLTLNLLDTAGIRENVDKIENIGIDKAKKAIKEADLILLLLDASSNLDKEDEKLLELTADKKRIIIYNKADLAPYKKEGELYISALKKDIKPLKEAIIAELNISEQSFNKASLASSRQLALLKKAKESLEIVKEDALNGYPVDVISVNLFSAYNSVLEILGEHNDFDLTEEIFSRFCVGK